MQACGETSVLPLPAWSTMSWPTDDVGHLYTYWWLDSFVNLHYRHLLDGRM